MLVLLHGSKTNNSKTFKENIFTIQSTTLKQLAVLMGQWLALAN